MSVPFKKCSSWCSHPLCSSQLTNDRILVCLRSLWFAFAFVTHTHTHAVGPNQAIRRLIRRRAQAAIHLMARPICITTLMLSVSVSRSHPPSHFVRQQKLDFGLSISLALMVSHGAQCNFQRCQPLNFSAQHTSRNATFDADPSEWERVCVCVRFNYQAPRPTQELDTHRNVPRRKSSAKTRYCRLNCVLMAFWNYSESFFRDFTFYLVLKYSCFLDFKITMHLLWW